MLPGTNNLWCEVSNSGAEALLPVLASAKRPADSRMDVLIAQVNAGGAGVPSVLRQLAALARKKKLRLGLGVKVQREANGVDWKVSSWTRAALAELVPAVLVLEAETWVEKFTGGAAALPSAITQLLAAADGWCAEVGLSIPRWFWPATFASYPSVAARQAVQQGGWGLWNTNCECVQTLSTAVANSNTPWKVDAPHHWGGGGLTPEQVRALRTAKTVGGLERWRNVAICCYGGTPEYVRDCLETL